MSENNNNNGSNLVQNILVASLALLGGIAIGMLFAPKSGRENRQWVKDQAGKIKDSAVNLGKKAEDKINEMRDKYSGERVNPTTYADENEIYNDNDR